MTVAELIQLLGGQDPDARVLVFDHLRSDTHTTRTISVNCILTMDSGGPVAILCNEDEGQ